MFDTLRRSARHFALLSVVGVVLAAATAKGQAPLQMLTTASTTSGAAEEADRPNTVSNDDPIVAVPLNTADEALALVNHVRQEIAHKISITRSDYPHDSIRTVLAVEARKLLAALGGRGCSGMHSTAYAELLLLTNRDDSARTIFAARIAAPGMTVSEKAYTYSVAIRLFGDYLRPARLPIAEQYLIQMRALGAATVPWQLESEYGLAKVYYSLYRYDMAARHAMSVAGLLSQSPYHYRGPMFDKENGRYSILIDAISHTPTGTADIAKFNERLRSSVSAPADSAAMEPMIGWFEKRAKEDVEQTIAAHALIGKTANPITSNYWINTRDTTEHTIALNDGKIRLLEFGSTACPPCVTMYSALQRIYEAMPGKVEPIIMTGTSGVWGNRVIPLDEEVAKLKSWFLDDRKVRFPIALYRIARTPTDYGESTEEENPNLKDYIFLGRPTVYLVDGTGTIRRVFVGYSREIEEHITEAVRHLAHETLQ